MSARDDLVELLAGRRPAGGVLQNCRMEAAGGDFYGEEAILERCRAHPYDLRDAEAVEAPGHLALFANGTAVVADLYDDRVGRFRLLGPGDPAEPEPAVAVAFDPDLAQKRGDVLADAADHPALDPVRFDALLDAARALVAEVAGEDPPPYRVRAFLIRAWSDGARAVGLLALHRLGPGPERAAGWSHAAVLLDGDAARSWRDRAGEAARTPWRPSL